MKRVRASSIRPTQQTAFNVIGAYKLGRSGTLARNNVMYR
jgi:hypothetical protein